MNLPQTKAKMGKKRKEMGFFFSRKKERKMTTINSITKTKHAR